eukprot:9142228-Pyramimonas_sp.AAC.1
MHARGVSPSASAPACWTAPRQMLGRLHADRAPEAREKNISACETHGGEDEAAREPVAGEGRGEGHVPGGAGAFTRSLLLVGADGAASPASLGRLAAALPEAAEKKESSLVEELRVGSFHGDKVV